MSDIAPGGRLPTKGGSGCVEAAGSTLAGRDYELRTILSHTPFMLAHCSAEPRYRFVSNSYARLFGLRPEEVAGKHLAEIMGEGFKTVLPYIERVLKGERVEFEISMYLKSVGARSFHAVYTSERDSRGTIKGFVASITDISAQRKADALIAADVRAMTLLQEVSSECVREGARMDECLHHIVDAAITIVGADKGNLQTLNRNTGTLNVAAQRGFQDQFLKFFKSTQDDAVSARAMQSGKPVIVEDVTSSEIFIRAPSQKVLLDAGVCGVISTPLMNSKGIPLGTVSTHFRQPHQPSERELRLVGLLARQAADYLERKRSEEIQKTLNYEIQHRANNLLAIVQSIARRTLSGDHTLSQAREAFEARLEAVARANLRLTKSNWSGLDLTEIVQTELTPFYDRVKIEGPIVTLDPQQGQNLALALHELATNAAKYGAFSNASGTVRVFWTITRGDDGSSLLNFKWQERGGPPVIVPTRRGFGSKLISATSPNVRFNYLPEGLSCEIGVKLGADIPPE